MNDLWKRITAVSVLLLALVPAASGQGLRAGVTKGAKAKESADQSKDSGDEVERLLERYVLAQGGVALFSLRTRVVRGRVEMSESPLPGSFESYSKGLYKEMTVVNAPTGQFITAKDKGSRWQQAPWGTATAVGFGGDDALLEQAANGKGFKWRNAFTASRLKGRATVDGREMIVLAATPRGHKPMLMYFDAETYLLRKQEPDRTAGGWKDDPLKAIYIDSYATVDGVKVPALFRVIAADFTFTFRVTEVRHNVYIDDALFRSPEGK
jgi:hypothetical protein